MIYGYCRVSTTKQAEEGESLGAQERTIAGYAMMKGMAAPAMHVERGVSGSIAFQDRPEGKLLFEMLKPGDVIIAPKLDRMFRSALDALELLKKLKAQKIELHLIDLGGDVCSGGISQLIFTILAAVAESERDRIRERIRDVKRDQAREGIFLGGTKPYGYDVGDDGSLIPNASEQEKIKRMRELSLTMSARGIAKAIGGISHVTVSKILSQTAQ